MQLAAASLDERYRRESGALYLTGSQALVRLVLMQKARDRRAGLHTGGFVSGYRGSPMHNADKELWRAQPFLDRADIHFRPAVNEDLAATACWGTQQINLFPGARFDGVFAIWYGKGPGLDRSVDAIRHANLAGTSRHGGVLAVVGDDHGMKSSDVPATSEPTFIDLMMPVLYPASVREILEYGLYGFALSRYCGAWVGFKTVADTLDTAVSILIDDPEWPVIVEPEDFELPPDGLHIRVPDPWTGQEPRLRRHKMAAALAFARANRLNRRLVDARTARLGVVASGKAALDVMQALADLGLDETAAAALGLRVLKVAMPHPADLEGLRAFADGLDEILVVEEKRRIIETQVKDALYALPDGRRPRVLGRRDERGEPLLSELGELSVDDITRALARCIGRFHESERIAERLAFLDAREIERHARAALNVSRQPWFCSGCPHNRSTQVPSGSRAHGGVGCHFMATYMERDNFTHTQMGGEGATWIGQAPFVDTPHVFQNLGDGTYFHCGLLAIRACVAAGVNITYKILHNDAVAMTGGQPVDGPLDPMRISRQVRAEGVRRIVVVSEEPEHYGTARAQFAEGTRIEHRDALDRVQRELRECPGVSVLIYDQTCAAEKRRRRKRGRMPDPPRRLFINERVCEGCGDCSAKSNCLSVVPLQTEFGRKRRIDQSSCNKDFTCAEGFCPSFVTVHGARPRRARAGGRVPDHLRELPEATPPALEGRPYGILVTGIGGTGVVTLGAMITMAAHLEGKACSSVDQFGMAQKGGAVTSHLRVAARADDISAVRLNAGAADLLLGCDGLVAGSDLALDTIARGRTHAIVNRHEAITGHFVRDPDTLFPSRGIAARLEAAAGRERVEFLDATRLATGLMGDSIATNLFMLGYAWQKGLVPVSAAGIERAIELNGVAVESNRETFRWGRRAAVDLEAIGALVAPERATPRRQARGESVETLVERRAEDLVRYQDRAYAERYRTLVAEAQRAESRRAAGKRGFAPAVARCAYRLMAYKDEYEVARLFSDGTFAAELERHFEGDIRLEFHLAPPLFAPRDPDTGLPRKRRYGPWMMGAMRLLARFRTLRGTRLDPFGYREERRTERRLVEEYEALVRELAGGLDYDNHAMAVEIASLPEGIRGYGHVKAEHLARVRERQAALLGEWRRPAETRAAS